MPTSADAPPPGTLPPALARFVEESRPLDRMTRTLLLLDYADRLPPYPEDKMDEARRVRGCASRVYLDADYDRAAGAMRYQGWADAETVKGLVAVLVTGLDGLSPNDVLAVTPGFVHDAGLDESLTATRQGGFAAVLARMQAAAKAALVGTDDG